MARGSLRSTQCPVLQTTRFFRWLLLILHWDMSTLCSKLVTSALVKVGDSGVLIRGFKKSIKRSRCEGTPWHVFTENGFPSSEIQSRFFRSDMCINVVVATCLIFRSPLTVAWVLTIGGLIALTALSVPGLRATRIAAKDLSVTFNNPPGWLDESLLYELKNMVRSRIWALYRLAGKDSSMLQRRLRVLVGSLV